MNPEFRRNLWLEFTPRRLMTMTAVLLLVFFAAAVTSGDRAPAGAAVVLYYFIVVFWGARNAALSVVGEIRDRTWDLQRLSSLGAGEMTWGKLFGSTVFNWYGGAICLVAILADRIVHNGIASSIVDLVFFVLIGVIAQSAALLASLVAALRRQSHSRLEVFSYQAVGLFAALLVYNVWDAADPAGAFAGRRHLFDTISWWSHSFNSRGFLLASLALFAGWTLLGCYRAMRRELKMHNGPLVWIAFLAFMGVYVAGFDVWLPQQWVTTSNDAAALRLALAASTYALITYAMVLFEPKDAVLYRWMGAEFVRGHLLRLAGNVQGWMLSYKAAFWVTVALIAVLAHDRNFSAVAFSGATIGFLTRDVGLFVLLSVLPGQRRGDFAALVTLFALYGLAPAILSGLDLKDALVLFYPRVPEPLWLGPAIAWTEAAAVWAALLTRLFAGNRKAA